MTKWMLMLLSAITLLAITACDQRTDNPVRPDFANPNWVDEFDAALSINAVAKDGRSGANLRTKTDPGFCSLSLNGSTPTVGVVTYNATDEYWYATFDILGAYAGSTISYELIFGDKTYNGNMLMPSMISAAFQGFDPDSDYLFSWVCQANPRHFIVDMNYAFENQFYKYRNDISGAARTYTIKKTQWDENAVTLLDMSIMAVNYNTKAKNLVVFSMTSDSYQRK